MKKKLLEYIVCPKNHTPLNLEIEEFDETRNEVKSGRLISNEGTVYQIRNYIPRFTVTDDYVKSFSFQWQIHKVTQYSSKENPFSENQIRQISNWNSEKIRGKLILDAGCGSGRFSEILTRWGAEVVAVDLSYAVDSAESIIGERKNVHIIQASIFELPFRMKIFDYVWSYGVLMTTPDTKSAFNSLVPYVKKDGELAIWIYSNYNKIHTFFSDLWRKLTIRIPNNFLYKLCYVSVPLYYFYKIPGIGHILRNIFIISMRNNWRWRVLETFDWYSPKYQWKHRYPEVFEWMSDSNFEVIHMAEPPIGMVGLKL